MAAELSMEAAAAGLIAVAVWLAVPPAVERRLAERVRWRLPAWAMPVPDALGTRPRGLASGGLALAVVLWAPGLGWLGMVLAAVAGAATYLLLGRVTPAGAARRQAELVAALPQVCDLLAVAIESGLPLRRAVEVVAPAVGGVAGGVLDGVIARVRLGGSEAEAWAELEHEPALQTIAREVSRTVASGLGLAPLLRELAVEARRAAAAAALVKARQVGVRSVLPLMCCFLPAFVLLGVVPILGGIISTVFP